MRESVTLPLIVIAISTSILALFRLGEFFKSRILPFFTAEIGEGPADKPKV